jgi:hypothetical protein
MIMKTKILSVSLILLLSGYSALFSQGFQPPPPEKAVVYFVRASKYFKIHVEHFNQDKYIGKLPRGTYLRYECDPGKQLFWANSDTVTFITADLKKNETYLVFTYVTFGRRKGNVIFDPVYATDNRFNEAKETINSKPPVVTPQSKIDEMNKKLAEFIPKQLKRFEEAQKTGKIFKHIAPDMAVPADAMK